VKQSSAAALPTVLFRRFRGAAAEAVWSPPAGVAATCGFEGIWRVYMPLQQQWILDQKPDDDGKES